VDKSWAVLRSAETEGVGWVELAKRAQAHRDRQMVGRRPGKPGLDPPYGPTLAYLLSTRPSILADRVTHFLAPGT